MKIYKYFLLFLLACIVISVKSQNLISNSNFETYSSCPSGIGLLPNATGWFSVTGHTGSPDYMNTCTANTMIGVPSNAFGNQMPASGNGYIGFCMYYLAAPNFREYVQTQLSSPLVAGETYTISFNASLGDNAEFYAPCFQFYFSNAALTWAGGNWAPINTVVPQVSSANIISNKTTWSNFSASYTAVGGEKFLTMGNFRDDASTPGVTVAAGGWTYAMVYYYIDDFTFTKIIPVSIELLDFNAVSSGKDVKINWSTASEVNNDYFTVEKSIDSKKFEDVAKVQGAGNSNSELNYSCIDNNPFNGISYYRLKQTDYDGQFTYSKIVTISSSENNISFSEFSANSESISMMINSNNDELLKVNITDLAGRSVFSSQYQNEKGSVKINIDSQNFAKGVYFIKIEGQNCGAFKKFGII